MQKRKSHTKEFKLEVVRLLDRGDKMAAGLARELNVRRNQLYKWKEQLAGRGESAFPGQGRRARVVRTKWPGSSVSWSASRRSATF